jgi:SAM-dependent MidA family methyltransferase
MPFSNATVTLPVPLEADRIRSAELSLRLREEITRAGGAIDFSYFMAAALYTPTLGYYASGTSKLGPCGDFVTAPELGSVFGATLARQCAEILQTVRGGSVLEAGAGRGRLAAQLLLELETLQRLPERYFILEISDALRHDQAETLQRLAPRLASRVTWLSTWPEDFRGAVIANEVLDAMPVERVRVTPPGLRQLQVGIENDRFVWKERHADEAVARRLGALHLPVGYVSEINFQAEAWIRSLGNTMSEGVALLIDYGFPRAEFYHPDRVHGTLMCHYRHLAHADPFFYPGLGDITAHVDFTALAEAALDAQFEIAGYTGQAMFLLGCGLTSVIEARRSSETTLDAKLVHEVHQLTSPAEMGELFKVLALSKKFDVPLSGFSLHDRRDRLG